jgi:uncharacterized protein
VSALSLILGAVVGFSLGLTGGGGALFAVPLLVYGLQLEPRSAVGASLVTVAVTAAIGFVQRLRAGLVEVPAGLLFATLGMLTAPLGAWLSRQIPESLLLVLFGGLMLVIAARMLLISLARRSTPTSVSTADDSGRACRRNPQGALLLNSRCALIMAAVGMVIGVLTGLFGVGGGFLMVPAFVAFSSMSMQRAIGTSLLVITLVSISGIASHFLAGGSVPWAVTGLFLAGGVGGMIAASAIAKYLEGPRLQQVFAVSIVAVGLFVVARNLWS